MRFWVIKSEPDVFSFADLQRVGREPWNGVRNYQARNFLRQMRVGDLCLFYHSNAKPPGLAGVARVEALGLDTYADARRFFSYRRATHRGEASYGRQIAIVAVGQA